MRIMSRERRYLDLEIYANLGILFTLPKRLEYIIKHINASKRHSVLCCKTANCRNLIHAPQEIRIYN